VWGIALYESGIRDWGSKRRECPEIRSGRNSGEVARMQQQEREMRRSPVAMPAEEFRGAGHRLVDRIADFLDSLPDGKVTPGESPAQVREALGAGRTLPESGANAGALLGARGAANVRSLAF